MKKLSMWALSPWFSEACCTNWKREANETLQNSRWCRDPVWVIKKKNCPLFFHHLTPVLLKIYILWFWFSKALSLLHSLKLQPFQNNCIVLAIGSLTPVFYTLFNFYLLLGIFQAPLSCLAPADVPCDWGYSVLSFSYYSAFDSDTDQYIIDQILSAAHSLLVLY